MRPRRGVAAPALSSACAMKLGSASCPNLATCEVDGASYCERRDPAGPGARQLTHASLAAFRARDRERRGVPRLPRSLGTLYRAGARRDREQEALHAALDDAFAEPPAAKRRRLHADCDEAATEVARREREAVAALARLMEATAVATAARAELAAAFPDKEIAAQ